MARKSNKEERRRQIALALMEVMATSGYSGATITAIAKAAELTPGLVHYHFKNKLEILLHLVVIIHARYEARLDAALSTLSRPEAQLDAFIDLHLSTGSSADPELTASWVLIAGESQREASVKVAFAGILRRSAEQLEAILHRGRAEGVFSCREGEVPAAATALLCAIQGYVVVAATARDLIPRGSAARQTKRMAAGLLYPLNHRVTP